MQLIPTRAAAISTSPPNSIARPTEAPPQFRSKPYLEALDRLKRFALAGSVTILLEGESGTGKTFHAGQVHLMSARRNGPFQMALMSAVSDSFGESELFGHVAGAFTDARQPRQGLFASAANGTLFLDEIGKASLHVQDLLLHVVEYGEMKPLGGDKMIRVDVRLVLATNVPLEQLIDEGKFRRDLRPRLGNFKVELPPLRDRRADIPILVEFYITRHAASCGYAARPSVHPELMAWLESAPWPDNLRELDATVHRLLVDAAGAEMLTPDLCTADLSHLRSQKRPKRGTLHLADVENAIAVAGGDKSKAARHLSVDRTTIYRILEREGGFPP